MSVETSETAPDGSSAPSTAGLGRWERVGSGVVGGALLALGLGRRSLGGTAMALAGGWLSYRAVSGRGRSVRAFESVADRRGGSTTVEAAVTVGKPADELSELVRDPETLDRVVGPFADVSSAGEGRHRWNPRGSLERVPSWETRIVEERSGERLRWEPVEGPAAFDEWSMEFGPAPGDRGTEVTLRVRLPGGTLSGAGIERLDVVPEALINETLDRFKSLAETGEVPTIEDNPSGRGRGDLL